MLINGKDYFNKDLNKKNYEISICDNQKKLKK